MFKEVSFRSRHIGRFTAFPTAVPLVITARKAFNISSCNEAAEQYANELKTQGNPMGKCRKRDSNMK